MTSLAEAPLPLAASREPGVYDGITLEEYHSDQSSLSSSGAKKLLPPSCPAKFKWALDHPEPPKPHFEFGTAAHKLVLGEGPELVPVDAPDWRSKAARAERDAIREEGAIPLLAEQFDELNAMADAIRRHPVASALFAPGSGKAEQSLYWRHNETGILRRARPDWLPYPRLDGRLIVPDYKSCRSGDVEVLRKDVANFGYHCQAAWYLAGIKALGLHGDHEPVFVFVCQEKDPPYLITIVQPDRTALDIGRRLNADALRIYADCQASGVWPGHADDVEVLALPPYIESLFK